MGGAQAGPVLGAIPGAHSGAQKSAESVETISGCPNGEGREGKGGRLWGKLVEHGVALHVELAHCSGGPFHSETMAKMSAVGSCGNPASQYGGGARSQPPCGAYHVVFPFKLLNVKVERFPWYVPRNIENAKRLTPRAYHARTTGGSQPFGVYENIGNS